MTRIIFLISILTTTTTWAAQNFVYFIKGGPIDTSPNEVKGSLRVLTNFMEIRHAGDSFAIFHNSSDRAICNEIKENSKRGAIHKLIIIGHSYGGQSSTWLGHCLRESNITINATVTIDPVQRPMDVDPQVIPSNIIHNYNFFQTADPFLRGLQNNHREDGSKTGITNTFVELPPGISPHHDIVVKLVKTDVIQNILDQELSEAVSLTDKSFR